MLLPRLIFIFFCLLALTATGKEVMTIQPTSFYAKKNGKTVLSAEIPKGAKLEVTGKVLLKKYVPVKWEGQSGWVVIEQLKSNKRNTASISPQTSQGQIGVGADAGTHSQSIGFGFGVTGTYQVPLVLPPLWRADTFLSFRYFPSAVNSTAFEVTLGGRGMYRMLEKLSVGGDLGLMYLSYKTPDVVVPGGYYTGSSAFLGAAVGPVAAFEFSPELHALLAGRLIIFSETATLFTLGLEYRF